LLRTDPASSEEEHLRIVLAQTEVERVKFVVRSYLRTRLFKVTVQVSCIWLSCNSLFRLQIEKYARYIVTNVDVQTRLSQTELDHASRLAHYINRHFHTTVLQSLPYGQASLDDSPSFAPPMSMMTFNFSLDFLHEPTLSFLQSRNQTLHVRYLCTQDKTVVE
jgi:GINS complex subunit 4